MANRDKIVKFLNDLLNVATIKDSSVNGLQVEGTSEIKKIGLATDASLSLYEKAKEEGCQMLVTHHGLIWNSIRSVTGRDYQHLKCLMDHEINLYGVHLPLDLHPEVGNNICLAKLPNLQNIVPFGNYHGVEIGFSGTLPKPMKVDELTKVFTKKIGGTPMVLPFGKETVESIAIVSGGGSSAIGEAVEKGIDCFITGEGSHQNHHEALEGNLNVLFLGHYHTETLGVKALGEELKKEFDVETVFIDIPTLI